MAKHIITKKTPQPAVFPQAAAELLKNGRSIRFSAAGNSMHPTIKQGDTLFIEPCDPTDLLVGDIALYMDGDRLFAHRIIRIYAQKGDESEVCNCQNDQGSRTNGLLLQSCRRQDDPQTQCFNRRKDLRYVLRGDFRSNPDPPVTADHILGKIIAMERNNQILSPYRCGRRLIADAYRMASQLKSHLQV